MYIRKGDDTVLEVKNKLAKPIIGLVLTVLCLVNLYPFVYMLFMSFKTNEEIMVYNPFGLPQSLYLENYSNAWTKFNIPVYFKNSVIVTLISVTLTVLFALLFSYATARMQWRFSKIARAYISLGLFVPMQIILIPMTVLVKRWNFANTYAALILPYIAFELAFACLITYGFMRQIPYEFEEAASIDGAGIVRTFFVIICPLLVPAIAASFLYAFIGVWNEFTVALVMISKEELKTLPLGMINFRSQNFTDWGGMGAAMVIASLPAVLLYAVLGEQLEKALAIGAGIKG